MLRRSTVPEAAATTSWQTNSQSPSLKKGRFFIAQCRRTCLKAQQGERYALS